MLNLVSLGADVVALGRIGSDAPGGALIKAIKDEGVDTSGIGDPAGLSDSGQKSHYCR